MLILRRPLQFIRYDWSARSRSHLCSTRKCDIGICMARLQIFAFDLMEISAIQCLGRSRIGRRCTMSYSYSMPCKSTDRSAARLTMWGLQVKDHSESANPDMFLRKYKEERSEKKMLIELEDLELALHHHSPLMADHVNQSILSTDLTRLICLFPPRISSIRNEDITGRRVATRVKYEESPTDRNTARQILPMAQKYR
jgi:hypothetical protein